MKIARMFELAATLPGINWESVTPWQDAKTRALRQCDIDEFAAIYNALDFGWRYVKALIEADSPLPYDLEPAEEALYRCYVFESGIGDDPDLVYAIALAQEHNYYQASVIQGLLLVPGATWRSVARHVRLPVDVIMLYEQLFFNVLDRKNERLFISKLVFPQGRIGALANEVDRLDVRMVLRRAGYENGAEDVLWAAGITRGFPQGAMDASRCAKELEEYILKTTLFMAKNGFLYDREKMRDGISLIMAGRRKRHDFIRHASGCSGDEMAKYLLEHLNSLANVD